MIRANDETEYAITSDAQRNERSIDTGNTLNIPQKKLSRVLNREIFLTEQVIVKSCRFNIVCNVAKNRKNLK